MKYCIYRDVTSVYSLVARLFLLRPGNEAKDAQAESLSALFDGNKVASHTLYTELVFHLTIPAYSIKKRSASVSVRRLYLAPVSLSVSGSYLQYHWYHNISL